MTPSRASRKAPIIELLFEDRWDERTHRLRDPVVSLDEVADAIRRYNAEQSHGAPHVSDRNPANFFKDFIRRRGRANANWPASVTRKGYTARQRTGEGRCFEFVPMAPGQREPFSPACPAPDEHTPTHRIQSASLPPLSRRLGRRDEPWLLQVMIRLRILETHLVLESRKEIVYVDHLQMNVKLRNAEIDALFLAVEQLPDERTQEIILTLEAKRSDDILADQILSQVRAVFAVPGITQDIVIPMAAKSVGPSKLHVVEFSGYRRAESPDLPPLRVASQALYELVPPVQGI